MCAHGYDVASGHDASYFGADLLHRLLHTAKIAEDATVDHFADAHADLLRLAIEWPARAVRNSASLRKFAVEAYAFDVAVPGVGCAGVLSLPEVTSTGGGAATASASVTPTVSTSVTAAAATTSPAAAECHSHSDGVVHCA